MLSIPIGERGAPRLVVVSVHKYAPGVVLGDKNIIHDMSLVISHLFTIRIFNINSPPVLDILENKREDT